MLHFLSSDDIAMIRTHVTHNAYTHDETQRFACECNQRGALI